MPEPGIQRAVYDALLRLDADEDTTVPELATAIGCPFAPIWRTIRGLNQQGLLHRRGSYGPEISATTGLKMRHRHYRLTEDGRRRLALAVLW